MNNTGKKVGYLKGLLEAIQPDESSASDKLLRAIVDVLGDLSDRADVMDDLLADLNDYVESIDDDLAELEETLFGEDELDGEDEDVAEGEDDEDELGEDDLILYACPHCGHEIEFHASDVDFDEDYLCPACDKPIFPELKEDE